MRIVITILSLFLWTTTYAQNAQLIILLGQSNAQGQELRTTLQPSYSSIDRCMTWDGSAWVALDTSSNQQPPAENIHRWGLSLPLVMGVKNYADKPVYLISYTVGGSILYDTAWNIYRCWSPRKRGMIFDSSTVFINNALAALPVVVDTLGIVWQQGESDGAQLSSAQKYDSSMMWFMDSLRIAISSPNIKVFIGRASVNCDSWYCPYFADTVRDRQAKYLLYDTKAILVDEDNVDYYYDPGFYHLHFSAQGNVDAAMEYLNEMKPYLIRKRGVPK